MEDLVHEVDEPINDQNLERAEHGFESLEDRAANRRARERAADKKGQPLIKKFKTGWAKFTKKSRKGPELDELLPPSPTVDSIHSPKPGLWLTHELQAEVEAGNPSELQHAKISINTSNCHLEIEELRNLQAHQAHPSQRIHKQAQETQEFVKGWAQNLRRVVFVRGLMKPYIQVVAVRTARGRCWALTGGLLFTQPGWEIINRSPEKYTFVVRIHAKGKSCPPLLPLSYRSSC
jgi:hypothetical protein